MHSQDLESNLVEAVFEIQNEGHMHHEIEIGLLTMGGNKFIGTITPKKQNLQFTRIGSMTPNAISR